MSKLMKFLLVPVAAASLAAAIGANAAELRPITCSVSIDYLLDNVVRAPYQKSFVINPGVPFSDDFSTFTRFRFLDASTHLEGESTVVTIDYYNDVGVFEAVSLRTKVAVIDDKIDQVSTGSHTYWTELGVAGDHTTNYTLACRRLKL